MALLMVSPDAGEDLVAAGLSKAVRVLLVVDADDAYDLAHFAVTRKSPRLFIFL
jgi:hypothetical protein